MMTQPNDCTVIYSVMGFRRYAESIGYTNKEEIDDITIEILENYLECYHIEGASQWEGISGVVVAYIREALDFCD